MILLANILAGLALVFKSVVNIALLLIVARAVLSWVNPDPYNPIVRFLKSSTDPMLAPLQRALPLSAGGIDLSPMLLIFLLYFLEVAIGNTLSDYAASLRATAVYGG